MKENNIFEKLFEQTPREHVEIQLDNTSVKDIEFDLKNLSFNCFVNNLSTAQALISTLKGIKVTTNICSALKQSFTEYFERKFDSIKLHNLNVTIGVEVNTHSFSESYIDVLFSGAGVSFDVNISICDESHSEIISTLHRNRIFYSDNILLRNFKAKIHNIRPI